jgi:hypothetical protein
VPVREQIDARLPLFPHRSECAEKWTLKQVQGDEEGFDLVLFRRSPTIRRPPIRHAELVSASIVQ